MAEDGVNNVSRIAASVGDFYKDESLPGVNIELTLGKTKAAETQAKIEKDSAGAVDSTFAIVMVIPVAPGSEDAVHACITTLASDQEYEGNFLKGLRRDVGKGKATFKITKADGKVILSIGMPEPMQQMIEGQIAALQGLTTIVESQKNSITIDLALGQDFSKIKDMRVEGNTLWCSLFNKISAEFKLSMNPGLPDSLKSALEPMLAALPPSLPIDQILGMVKLYKSIDIDF